MPEAAYELERFAPSAKKQAPRIKVAKRSRVEKQSKSLRLLGNLFMATVVVVLACGVLYTQNNITELQTQIASQQKELVEQKAMYAYLNFELESMSNIKNIEKRAVELGMIKMDGSQMAYVQVEEGDSIQVKESGVDLFLSKARTGFLSVMDYVAPAVVEEPE